MSTSAGDGGLTDDQTAFLRTMLLVLSPVSVISATFVLLTFTLFEEKRLVASWANTLLFVLSATLVDLLLLIGGAAGPDALAAESSVLCEVQGALLMLFGTSMIVFFFILTVHLYLRICRPHVEIKTRWLVLAGLVVPVVLTIPPVAADKIGFDGVWCFIESDETLYIYLNFYGPMGVACVLGAVMWGAIILTMSRSLQVAAGPDNPMAAQDPEAQAKLLAQPVERRRILMRQFAFVTVFELIFFTFFANRISVTVAGNSFGGWIFHTFAMCSCGLFTFLIWGLKQSNFELWYDAISSWFGRKPQYERF